MNLKISIFANKGSPKKKNFAIIINAFKELHLNILKYSKKMYHIPLSMVPLEATRFLRPESKQILSMMVLLFDLSR